VEIHVVTSHIENVATDPGMRVYPLMRHWSWLEMPRLLRFVRRCRPAVVDLHFSNLVYNKHPMVTFLPTILQRLMPDLRVVTHIEGTNNIGGLPLLTRVIRKAFIRWGGARDVDYDYGTILRDSDRIIVLSDYHRLILSRHFANVGEKCVLIPPSPIMPMCMEANGTARRRGREALGVAPDEFLIAYYGYLGPGKGLETLFEALHLIAQQREKIRLVAVGGSNEVVLKEVNRPHYVQELQDLTKQLGIADRIIWTGYYPTDSDQASLYLRGADACVLPFDAGVYLNNSSFTAAAAHGLPIVTTKGEFVELPFIDQKNVLLCPPKEPEALAAAINSLISRPELRQQLSTGALEMARQWFSWDEAIKRTIEIFREN
jgi:glycosyltransferase involved in cell wall biosynthesis